MADEDSLRERLQQAGFRLSEHRGGDRPFLLARSHRGERLEIEIADAAGSDRSAVFAEAFDRAVHARRAGHSLACWQATNEAIAGLVELIWEASRKPSYPTGILPPIRGVLPRLLRDQLGTLRAGLDLRESLADLRRILAFAQDTSGWLGAAGASLAEELGILRCTLEAERFWNLRDVAEWWSPWVRHGVLFRGRTPMAYADEGFWAWATERGLRRFVDLRGKSERLANPYPDDVAGCATCPLDLGNPQGAAGGLDAAYEQVALKSGPALRAVLEAIAEDDAATLVHCHAGVDRTGVVVALLGAWLGVPADRIDADYRASGQLVDPRRLAGALGAAERYGVERILLESGVEAAVLARAQARLLP